jgi:hypothetical protein
LKTLVEEQEIQSITQAAVRDQKSREVAVREFHVHQQTKTATAAAKPLADCYESCLDLSALFLPRG